MDDLLKLETENFLINYILITGYGLFVLRKLIFPIFL